MSMPLPRTIPVLDWHGVFPGYASYDEEGNYSPQDIPRGVRLSLQLAEPSEPVFRRKHRWEAGNLLHPTVFWDDGRLRMWYSALASVDDPWVKKGNIPGKYPGLWCYAESEDGFHWQRPNLGLYEYDGSTENNILLANGDISENGYGYMHMMRDLAGDPDERYKGIGIKATFKIDDQTATKEEALELTAKLQAAGDAGEIGERVSRQLDIVGGVSADGMRWAHLTEPVMETPWLLDTQNILAYDEDVSKYVIYLRSGRSRRRAVSRYEADSFRGPWTNHHMVLTAEPDDPVDWDIYAPCYCRHPHAGHLMFFSPFHRASDLLDVHLAVSHDGILWARPERKPILRLTEQYGGLWPAPEIVELDDNRWGVLTLASPAPHNAPYFYESLKNTGSFAEGDMVYLWAQWPRNRLVAWEADDYAEFSLSEQLCAGMQLWLNYKTLQPGAFVRVEIVAGRLPNRTSAAAPPPATGFSFADCDTLTGDDLDGLVSWGGKSDLSQFRGKEIHLRLQMARAKVFSLSM